MQKTFEYLIKQAGGGKMTVRAIINTSIFCLLFLTQLVSADIVAPKKFEAKKQTINSLTLNWEYKATDIKGFILESSKIGKSKSFKIVTKLPKQARQFVSKNLFDGTKYYYRISAVSNSGKISRWAKTFGATKLPIPGNLQVKDIGMNGTNISWEHTSNNATVYKIEYSASTTKFRHLTFVKTPYWEYNDRGLTSGFYYCYRVKALNDVAESDWSDIAGVEIK